MLWSAEPVRLRPSIIRPARGVDRDYIEFMMGHKTFNYNDVKKNSVEFMRGIYLTSGISIRPRIKLNKIETLKEIIRAWGLNPEKILKPELSDNQSNLN